MFPESGNSSAGPSKAADHKDRLSGRQWEQTAHRDCREYHHRPDAL